MLKATTEECLSSAEPRPISEILSELLPRYLGPSSMENHLQCDEFNSEINRLNSSGRSSRMGSRTGQILSTRAGRSSGGP